MIAQELKCKRYIITVLCCFVLVLPASLKGYFYQDTDQPLYFRKIPLNNNRIFQVVTDIEQDSLGFIWIGAYDGLYRYDGIKFVHYKHNRDNKTSLRSNWVSDLNVDTEGSLWIATESGLNKYNIETNDFIYYPINNGSDTVLEARMITSVVNDGNNNMWISTMDNGVYRFEKQQGSFTPLLELTSAGKGFNSDHVQTLFLDSEKILWIGSVSIGITYYNSGNGALNALSLKSNYGSGVSDLGIESIIEDTDGNIWFGTNSNGLFQYNKQTKRIKNYDVYLKNLTNNSNNTVWSLKTDNSKNLWVCTNDAGLLRYNRNKDSFSSYTKGDNEGTISSNNVRVLFQDRDNNYWAACLYDVLYFANGNQNTFKHFYNSLPELKTEYQNKITALYIDSSEKLWVGTNGAGILRYGLHAKIPETIAKVDFTGFSTNKPVCFDEDEKGNIWVGYYLGGLACYSHEGKLVQHYTPDGSEKSPMGKQVWSIVATDSLVWFCTELGIENFNQNTGIFSSNIETSDGNRTIRTGCLSIAEDSKGQIVFGTHNGVYLYNAYTKELKHHLPKMGDTLSLPIKKINTVFVDSQGRYWVGTDGGGLCLWDGYDRFITYNANFGLDGEFITGIAEDGEGNIWLTTNTGISKFNPFKELFNNYSGNDGIEENRFNTILFSKAKNSMIAGGENGITYFLPNEIGPGISIPLVELTGFTIYANKSNKISREEINVLSKEIIELSQYQNYFTIEFAALHFASKGNIIYRYRLKGVNNTWVESTDRNTATYNNLKPGKYTFEVQAAYKSGPWSNQSKELHLTIHPPFYKTTWFIILYIIAFLFILYKVHEFMGNKFRTQADLLSGEVSRRTRELEQRNYEIDQQTRKITKQRDIATAQRDQIIKQKEELEKHRNRLEELVEERTQDLVQAKEMAEASDRLKTAFLDNLSHQIRTPMNAILGFINLLTEKIDDVVSRDYYLRIINESGRSMLTMIHDIIDFSKMQTGELQPEYSECNVSNTIRSMVTSVREKVARENGMLNIMSDLPNEDLIMYCDDKKFRQIVSKLFDNALDATDKGFIKVGICNRTDKDITFYIEDTGNGLVQGNGNEIFDRFYSAQQSTDIRNRDSTGLGLAFAKVTVELLGGTIWAESTNEGTAIYFKLPFIRVQTKQIKPERSVTSPNFAWPGKHILVAEDEDSNYLLIEAILRDTQVKLTHVTDGVELLEIFDKGEEFDLVLLDLKMPRMGGLNAMKIIRESNKTIPVIVQTAYDQTNQREQCKQSGCNGFLVKPLRKRELLDAVNKFLG